MNAAQMATYQMTHGVKEHGDGHTDAWTGSVPFSNAFTFFETRLAVLDELVPKQLSPATLRAQKKAKRDSLRTALNGLVTGLRSFAYDHSRPEILEMARYTPSDINRMTLTDLAAIAEMLHGKTNKLLNEEPKPDLGPYGITAETQKAIAELTEGFNTLKGQEKAARAVPVEATARIAVLLTELTEILDNRLDNAAELLRASQPEFVAQYFIARRVDDAGSAALALTVHVQDGDGAPIARAQVSLSNGIARKTTEKGNCQVQNLPDGAYTVTISKQGYGTVTEEVNITGGETEALVVELVKE